MADDGARLKVIAKVKLKKYEDGLEISSTEKEIELPEQEVKNIWQSQMRDLQQSRMQ
jgi:hypothetical protein